MATSIDMTGLSDAERDALDGVEDSQMNEVRGKGAQNLDGDDVEEVIEEVAAEVVPDVVPVEPPEEVEKQDRKDFTPLFAAPAVEDFDVKIAALKEQEGELRAKLESGDIDIAAYDEEKTRILEERADLKSDQKLADFAAQQNEANQKARWQWEQERFFAQDTSAQYKDPILFAALDAAVKAKANDPANSSRSSGWFLEQADKEVRKLFGQAAADVPAAKVTSLPSRRDVPQTLATLPAASLPDTGAVDEFARLDKYSGMELERQLSRMSKDEVERYLRAA